MSIVITPNDDISLDKDVIFLAGPIQGAKDWQSTAIDLLKDQDCIIANPRREWFEHSTEEYNNQINWEHSHLKQADVVLFWLAREDIHNCARSYAQTTRFELGWMFGVDKKIIVGIEDGFTGASYIQYTLEKYSIETYSSLEDTCLAVKTYLKDRNK